MSKKGIFIFSLMDYITERVAISSKKVNREAMHEIYTKNAMLFKCKNKKEEKMSFNLNCNHIFFCLNVNSCRKSGVLYFTSYFVIIASSHAVVEECSGFTLSYLP